MNEQELLRQYEPIVRFTQGEMFFPCGVEEYVKRCGLWLRPPNHGRRPQLDEQPLDLKKLEAYSIENPIAPDHALFLRFVEHPLNGVEYALWRAKHRQGFDTNGRLARVGLFARLIGGLFDTTLLLRGNVPGGIAAAAEIKYQELRQADPRFVYYGRVLREGGYIILHYLFFYAMNNWRSGFYGVNDHEADWEQVFVYLTEDGDPAWVAYASHDFSGDDLRRRWDDPELVREGTHPVIFAGAGSHASYFQQGEYLANIQLPFLKPLFTRLRALQRVWNNTLQQGEEQDFVGQVESFLQVPFVDYARGDGLVIGPNYPQTWTPVLISSEMAWVEHFRGLWGWDTQDPLGGERAPAGPKYNRDGSTRQSWHDPLGWAGLHKVAPPQDAVQIAKGHIQKLIAEQDAIHTEIATLKNAVRELEIEVRALQPYEHLQALYDQQSADLHTKEAQLKSLYQQRTDLKEKIRATENYARGLSGGFFQGDPQAHIHHKHLPQPAEEIEKRRIAEFWASISSGLLLIGAFSLIFLQPNQWEYLLAGLVGLFAVVEAMLARRLESLLIGTTIVLALITTGILIYEFFFTLLFLGLIGLSGMIIWDNLRELRRL